MRAALCVLFAAASAAFAESPAGDATKLKLLDQYASGGVVHLIVENISGAPITPVPASVREASGFAPPIWWGRSVPPVIDPGARGRISIAFRRVDSVYGDCTVDLGAGNMLNTTLHTTDEPQPLAIAGLLVPSAPSQAALFLRNTGGDTISVNRIAIAGMDAPLLPDHGSSNIAPCDTAVLTIAYTLAPAMRIQDEPVLIEIETNLGAFYRHAYLFHPPLFAIRAGEVENAFVCPTHRHGTWDKSAREIFALARGDKGLLPEIHFCRNRLPEGLDALGQCLPRAIVNPQASNPQRGKLDAWAGLDEVARLAKRRTEPGIYTAMIESGSNFDGSFGTPVRTELEDLSAEDLRHTVYAELASGAKGIIFRLGDGTSPAYRQAALAIAEELATIAPSLTTLEPVTLHASVSQEGVRVSTLYAGPNALLVIALQTDSLAQRSGEDIFIAFDAPPWFAPETAREVGATWAESPVEKSAGLINLRATNFNGIAVFLVTAEK